MINEMNIPEPPPQQNDEPIVWDLVIQDMRERDKIGVQKYHTHLQPFNGRDALIDAYQEALDLVVYLRQLIYEKYNKKEIYQIKNRALTELEKNDSGFEGRE